MKSQLLQRQVSVKKSPIHGYGVFADQNIHEGEVIEECYALTTRTSDASFDHIYFQADDQSAIALGFGSIYNHSDRPNARYTYDSEHSLIIFCALRLIKQGEEICVSYGKDWFSSRKMQPKQASLGFRLRRFIQSLSPMIFMTFRACAVVLAGVLFVFLLKKSLIYFIFHFS